MTTKSKSFQPPTKEEFVKYIIDNKLNVIDPEGLWQGYNDGGWFDTKGNPVRNWMLKCWTLHRLGTRSEFIYSRTNILSIGKCCHRCGSGIRKSNGRAGVIWQERLPWCGFDCYKLWIKEGKPKY